MQIALAKIVFENRPTETGLLAVSLACVLRLPAAQIYLGMSVVT